jgi:hypothetical protein
LGRQEVSNQADSCATAGPLLPTPIISPQYTALATPTPTNQAQSYNAPNSGPALLMAPTDAKRPGRHGRTPIATAAAAHTFHPPCAVTHR